MAKWVIEPEHTVAHFTVRHMMITDVHGQFNKISGVISTREFFKGFMDALTAWVAKNSSKNL